MIFEKINREKQAVSPHEREFQYKFITEETGRQKEAILKEIDAMRVAADDLEKDLDKVAHARALDIYVRRYINKERS